MSDIQNGLKKDIVLNQLKKESFKSLHTILTVYLCVMYLKVCPAANVHSIVSPKSNFEIERRSLPFFSRVIRNAHLNSFSALL